MNTVVLSPTDIASFQNYVRSWSIAYGRHSLPWRQGVSPFHVLVSEVMLQQTQVERVIPKYLQFVARFPDPESLAKASPAELIQLWQGLGYNRRVLNLQKAMQVVTDTFHGQLPNSFDELLSLPGIGPYTASAVCTFAFNKPVSVIETNIRAVFIYHFFPQQAKVPDEQILPLITQTIDTDSPRDWYAALMDYGSHLKKVFPNPTRRSKQYSKQSSFKGSNRQLRGSILKLLSKKELVPYSQIFKQISVRDLFPKEQVEQAVESLVSEGFLQHKDGGISLRKD